MIQDDRPNIRSYRVVPTTVFGRQRFVTRLLIDGMLCQEKSSTRKDIAERKGREWLNSEAHLVRLG